MSEGSRLVVFCGPPCSGKTAVSSIIEESRSLPRLEMDLIRQTLFPQGSNTTEERRIAYAAMHYSAQRLLESGVRRALLVATYQPFQQRQAVASLADRFGGSLLILQFKVDPDDAAHRFLSREEGHAAQDLTVDRVRHLAGNFRYYHRAPILDSTRLSFAETCKVVEGVLDSVDTPHSFALPRRLITEWTDLIREAGA